MIWHVWWWQSCDQPVSQDDNLKISKVDKSDEESGFHWWCSLIQCNLMSGYAASQTDLWKVNLIDVEAFELVNELDVVQQRSREILYFALCTLNCRQYQATPAGLDDNKMMWRSSCWSKSIQRKKSGVTAPLEVNSLEMLGRQRLEKCQSYVKAHRSQASCKHL